MAGCASSQASFRVFMNKEIVQDLTQKDVESLAYTTRMPLPDFSETGLRLLMKMEMRDKFSASNVLPLAEMLKNIHRNELGKRVEKFHKSQKKEQKKKEHKKQDPFPADNMYQKCQITASIQTIKLQTKILLEQIEELQSTARNMGLSDVENVIKDAIAIIEVEFQEKLQLASSKLPQLRQDSVDSLDSSPSSLSSCDDSLSPLGTLERGTRQRSGANSKTRSLPRDFDERKKPMIPPVVPIATHAQATEMEPISPDEHVYEYVTRKSFLPSQISPTLTYYSSTDIVPVPASIQNESREQLVDGRDGTPQVAKPKPAVAKKPSKLKQNNPRDSTASDSSMYVDMTCNRDTSTGDSGFVDSKQFRKECPPRVPSKHSYTQLDSKQRDTVSSYATPEPQGDAYDDVSYGASYMNVRHGR